ncbi:FtsX-like permease family protein [Candidatus Harpocratesius sp.]
MGLRLIGKSIKMAMRSRRRFIVFTLMYTVLMAWMASNFESFIYGDPASRTNQETLMLAISIVSTLILSILYAWIVINYRKREIATLKCIGYTNANIRTIIIGELMWVTFISFIFVAEVLIHTTASLTYFYSQPSNFPGFEDYSIKTRPLLSIWPIVITLAMFIVAQIMGILVMYSKILKLRPIVALRILK